MESAGGDIELVQRALARGLFVNAARLEGTAYDLQDIARMGSHTYSLCRSGGGPGAALLRCLLSADCMCRLPAHAAAEALCIACISCLHIAACPTHAPLTCTNACAGPAPKLRMHPGSVLARAKPAYLLFFQVQACSCLSSARAASAHARNLA